MTFLSSLATLATHIRALENPVSIDLTASHKKEIVLKNDLPEDWVKRKSIDALRTYLRSKGYKSATWSTLGGTVYVFPSTWTNEQIDDRWAVRKKAVNAKGMTSMRIYIPY